MNTPMGTINYQDAIKSALTAAIASVALVIYNLVAGEAFDLFAVDWITVLKTIVNTGIAAFVGDIGRRIFTDQNGKLFGRL